MYQVARLESPAGGASMKRIAKRPWLLMTALGLALLTTGAVTVAPRLRGDPAEPPPTPHAVPAVPVTLARATARTVGRTVEVVGTLEGHDEVNIAPKVDGRVVRIHHDIGDEVAPGDALAE